MSSVEYLREFVNERLTAAAEEIFGVFQKTIVEYEEEINRQHRLLDIVWKPEIKLQRIELPQQHVCKEEEVLADQQLCIQERNSSLDQEDPEPPQIKEEQEEICTSQEAEQLVLKEDTETFMRTTYEDSDHSEDQTLYLNYDLNQNAANNEAIVNISAKSSVVSEANSDHQFLSHNSHVAESQEQKICKYGDSVSTRNAEPEQEKRHHKNNSHKILRNTHTCQTFLQCDTCGKAFMFKSQYYEHLRTHTDEKLHVCKTCGKRLSYISALKRHMRIHTGEKPYSCNVCWKRFSDRSVLNRHMRIHAGEEPYSCNVCWKRFSDRSVLKRHTRIHTSEKPYSCKTCGKDFRYSSHLIGHMRTHTGEKPYPCNTCGKRFCQTSALKTHARIHTGEKPYVCKTCGKDYKRNDDMRAHMRRCHPDETISSVYQDQQEKIL